jgi:hypothetical protein
MTSRKTIVFILCIFPLFAISQVEITNDAGKKSVHRAFNRALAKGQSIKAARILKRKLYRYDRRKVFSGDFDKSGIAVHKTMNWLKKQPNIQTLVADSCGAHICIWPGWADYAMIAKSNSGLVEYGFTVQLGRTGRLSYYAGSWWRHRPKFLYFKPVEGRMASFANNCRLEQENQRRMLNDNRLRFSADPGRLNWSIVDAPQFEDSEKNTLRFKIEFENLGLDTLRLAYPIHQNAGEKLLYVRFHDAIKPRSFVESRHIELILDGNTIGPDTLVLAPGARHSEWHSFNDLLNGDRDLRASHRIDSLPEGSYRVEIIYNPPKAVSNDSTLWRPSCDSISAWLPYMWKYATPEGQDDITIIGSVVDGPSEYENSFGFKSKYIGLVKVIETSDSSLARPGEIIAWKFGTAYYRTLKGRPIALEPFQTHGNRVRLSLNAGLPREKTRIAGYRLWAISDGNKPLELLNDE